QLNSTGLQFGVEELRSLSRSPDHTLLVASLPDRYGSYGKIGIALVEHAADRDTIKLLLMSCRVMTRGVGAALLGALVRR
ncbi:hypothetical protein NL533_35560, partial [Klebsiella pneumoniae]|nr:hypothetical protein [Klebsiella pneumoniae]